MNTDVDHWRTDTRVCTCKRYKEEAILWTSSIILLESYMGGVYYWFVQPERQRETGVDLSAAMVSTHTLARGLDKSVLHTIPGNCYLFPVWDISMLHPWHCACASVIPHSELLSYDNNNNNNSYLYLQSYLEQQKYKRLLITTHIT